ncbi:hypothetical protein CLV57_3131 [Mucilaginibacter auburnensis]|uniref:Uncharacterized protein n=1 Tax=Mucilaginibacter auburnensis TaxID=1457233 RepID=A0A2H9VNR3_9SPHI|nr:hypothetical protein CLV57_3131 [Mucilaginibacter auburnensis]
MEKFFLKLLSNYVISKGLVKGSFLISLVGLK